ncbi:hypothetical protein GCM10010317_076480 [Streptomyces mirabilis]|uniref:hypothetical protein n=1 Tax=Streptomyces mirabilis TaxID=68239 RepID=UPI00167CAD6D|nr:hypothetical protein [Streptomyces mirabilis]GHD70039.1 hypothetical protein GCM10010317_076480 [Streptomyces mirabilis]
MSSRDTWNGQPLPDRKRISKPLAGQIHYRLYDQNGQLLSFNSTNSLASLVADVEITAREHPTAKITLAQFDGPV